MTDWLALANRMIHGKGSSTMTWRHITRVEDATTGEVTETTADQSFQGAVTDPVRIRMFSDAVLTKTSTAIVVRPQDFVAWSPAVLDQVLIATGQWLRVVDIRPILSPGGAGLPVPAALMAALGSP